MKRARSDDAVLQEIGTRLAQYRLNRNLTQRELAREAGVSLSTVTRIEDGKSAQLTNLIRVLRALGLLDNLEALVPAPRVSPLQQLELRGKQRRRASSKKEETTGPAEPWTWDLPR